jgi:hypothetical protein
MGTSFSLVPEEREAGGLRDLTRKVILLLYNYPACSSLKEI